MDSTEPCQHFGLDLKSSFTRGKSSTLWHDLSPPPSASKRLRSYGPSSGPTPARPKTIVVEASLTFAAAELFANRESTAGDLSTLAAVENWQKVNCWTTRSWEKFVRQALLDDALKNVLWHEQVGKNKKPVINVKGFGGLDLSIRGFWLRWLLEGLGFTLTDACGSKPLQLIEVHPALALALWWQERRTRLFPNYKSDWPNFIKPLVKLLRKVYRRTPNENAFANEDDLDCFVAWLITWFFHKNKTVTLGCLRDGFVVVPRTRLAVAFSKAVCEGKAEM
jgi:hypothetical protein